MTHSSKPSRDVVNKIFGDELPQKSVDERDDDSAARDIKHDDWLRDNIPPHHE